MVRIINCNPNDICMWRQKVQKTNFILLPQKEKKVSLLFSVDFNYRKKCLHIFLPLILLNFCQYQWFKSHFVHYFQAVLPVFKSSSLPKKWQSKR